MDPSFELSERQSPKDYFEGRLAALRDTRTLINQLITITEEAQRMWEAAEMRRMSSSASAGE